jgi:hypothetical protein
MNARAIKPTVMNVMPRPRSPAGMSLYFSFSRMPASRTIASAQPTPDPKPKDHAFREIVIAFDHEQRAAENGTVDRDQREKDPQRV